MLVSVGQIKQRSFDGIPIDWTQDRDAIQEVINGVVDRIETYLRRPLGIGSITQYSPDPQTRWLPILKPVKYVAGSNTQRFNAFEIILKAETSEVTYVGGYTYETLPADIKMVIYRLTAYELNKARVNDYGLTSKTVQTGSTQSNITKESGNYEQEQLETLHDYRNMQFYQTFEYVEGDTEIS